MVPSDLNLRENKDSAAGLGVGAPPSATTALGAGCLGFIAEAPDLRLFYEPGRNYPLIIETRGDADVTLVVNDPEGEWHCDDDSGSGLNGRVLFSDPGGGQYDIWVGTYANEGYYDADILISEIDDEADATESIDIATYRDWEVTTYGDLCYAESAAVSSEPRNAGYAAPDVWIEISENGIITPILVFGYDPDPGYDVSAFIDGGRAFDFVPDDAFAVLHGRQEISDFLAALRRGINMIVVSVDDNGVDRTDTYSLLGFTAAMNRTVSECDR